MAPPGRPLGRRSPLPRWRAYGTAGVAGARWVAQGATGAHGIAGSQTLATNHGLTRSPGRMESPARMDSPEPMASHRTPTHATDHRSTRGQRRPTDATPAQGREQEWPRLRSLAPSPSWRAVRERDAAMGAGERGGRRARARRGAAVARRGPGLSLVRIPRGPRRQLSLRDRPWPPRHGVWRRGRSRRHGGLVMCTRMAQQTMAMVVDGGSGIDRLRGRVEREAGDARAEPDWPSRAVPIVWSTPEFGRTASNLAEPIACWRIPWVHPILRVRRSPHGSPEPTCSPQRMGSPS